jgi:hypothetical protein
MEGIQILLIIVVVTLTMLLVFVGVQVLLVIFGIKRILKKVEQKIDLSDAIDAKFVSEQARGIKNFIKTRFFKKR